MALFSKFKSKSKKASKEEEKKAAADAKAAAQPVKAPQRGRNGKIIPPAAAVPEKAINDIPAPSQLPRHFHSPLGQGHGRNYSFEEQPHTENGKPEHFNPHLSSDSGYASPAAESRTHSRDPSTQQPRRNQDYLSASNKSMPQLTLGEELAQEPAFADQSDRGRQHPPSENTLKPSKSLHTMRKESRPDQLGPLPTPQNNQHHYQDGRQQRMIQQSMPMRPASVPAQALQPRHQRVNRPPPQRSSSPGPVLQSAHPALSSRSHASASPNTGSPFDWESPSARSHQSQLSSFQPPRSPTSPSSHVANPSYDHDEITPSLNILSGLKVNKRGLILDEEGDPIGELFEGDIIDCVRQKADAQGGVLDEYGRVVGRVRTLSIRSPGTSLHRSNTNATNASNVDHRRSASPAPPVPALSSAREPHNLVEGQHNAPQSLGRTSSHYVAQREVPSSPTRLSSTPPQHNSHEQEDDLSGRPVDPQESEVSQQNLSELAEQHELSAPRHEGSTRRSESLPSVPESRSTAEVVLSDNGSATSDDSHQALTTHASQHTVGGVASQERVSTHQGIVQDVEDATSQQPQVAVDADRMEQSMRHARQREQPAQVYAPPTINRSVSERAMPSAGLPPVPAVPKNYMDFNKAAHVQPIGQYAAPNRVKAPLPAFPGRGVSVGLAGGSFGNGPMPGMPNRRMTTHGFPSSPALNMSGLHAQSPFAKSHASTPLIRSPLSSQETTPPESDHGSAQGDTRPANRMQGHSRSQSLKTVNTASGVAGAGKPRRVFAKATPEKSADIVVQEMGDDKKTDKKKKGMKGLFGKKK